LQLVQELLANILPGPSLMGPLLVSLQALRDDLSMPARNGHVFRVSANPVPERLDIIDLLVN